MSQRRVVRSSCVCTRSVSRFALSLCGLPTRAESSLTCAAALSRASSAASSSSLSASESSAGASPAPSAAAGSSLDPCKLPSSASAFLSANIAAIDSCRSPPPAAFRGSSDSGLSEPSRSLSDAARLRRCFAWHNATSGAPSCRACRKASCACSMFFWAAAPRIFVTAVSNASKNSPESIETSSTISTSNARKSTPRNCCSDGSAFPCRSRGGRKPKMRLKSPCFLGSPTPAARLMVVPPM